MYVSKRREIEVGTYVGTQLDKQTDRQKGKWEGGRGAGK